jgi:hypothetical protein
MEWTGVDAPIVPQTASLSLISADWFFVEFADGATQFVLPPQWHGALNKYISLSVRQQGPTMVTSFSSTPSASRPSLSPRPSLYGSHGSFSPLNSPNLHPVFGHTPYTPNPYVPMYTGSPQFVQPPPLPQPTYNVTNVYNTIQRPEQPASHGNGTVQLLGGALKVAGALLPLFTGGNNGGNGTGFSF